MSLKGDIECLGLVEIVSVIHAGGHSGILKINDGQTVKVLRFLRGDVGVPAHGRHATYKIGNLLLRTTSLGRAQLEEALAAQRDRGGRLGDILVAAGHVTEDELARALSLQYKEEIYDLFLRERAHFEFEKDILPDGFLEDVERGRTILVPVPSIVVEVVRRVDEWKRIRTAVPSLKMILEEVPGKGAAIAEALAAAKVDPRATHFDGRTNLAAIFDAFGATQFESYRIVFQLLRDGLVAPADDLRLRALAESALARGDRPHALRCLEAGLETDRSIEAALALADHVIAPVAADAGAGAPDFAFSLRTKGKRALYVFLSLFALEVRGRLSVVEGEARRVLWLGETALGVETSGGASTPDVIHYASRRGLLDAARIDEIAGKRRGEGRALASILLEDGYLTPRDWTRILTDKLVDEIYDIFFWSEPFVEFRSPAADDAFGRGPSSLRLQMPYSVEGFLDDLQKNLDRVRQYLAEVPSVRSVFVDARGAPARDEPARDVLSLFNGRRSVSDVLGIVHWARRDMLHFLHRSIEAGQLRALAPAEYAAEFDRAVAEGRFRDAQALSFSAIDAEIEPEAYERRLERARFAEEESRPSAIEGDFQSVNLADILQSLERKQLSGTLEVSDGKRTKTVYFQHGTVFLLRKEEVRSRFADEFLGEGTVDLYEETWGDLVSKGLVDETEISEELALSIKNEVWEMFIWEGALFSFERNVLPGEFFDPESRVTRLMLRTDAFMLEAVRRINEWEELKHRIPDAKVVFRFCSPERKMQAITEKGNPEVLLLLDGRRALGELVRVSGFPRVEVYRLLADLDAAGALVRVPPEESPA